MRILTLIILTFLSLFAIERGGYGGFSIGLALPDVSEFNDHFSNYQISDLPGKPIGIGGGAYAIVNRLLIGGNYYSVKESAESDSIHTEFVISSGTFKIGYNIFPSRHLNGMLTVGFGSTSYNLGLKPLLGDVTFEDLLIDPGRYVELEAGHFLINPEAMIIFSLPVGTASFFHIGISGGFNINIFGQDWNFDGKKILNAPETGSFTPVFNVYFLLGGGA